MEKVSNQKCLAFSLAKQEKQKLFFFAQLALQDFNQSLLDFLV